MEHQFYRGEDVDSIAEARRREIAAFHADLVRHGKLFADAPELYFVCRICGHIESTIWRSVKSAGVCYACQRKIKRAEQEKRLEKIHLREQRFGCVSPDGAEICGKYAHGFCAITNKHILRMKSCPREEKSHEE